MGRLARIFSSVVALCVVIALSSCSSPYYLGEDAPELSSELVRGTWIHDGPGGVVAAITLNEDHTFTVSNIPLLSPPSTSQDSNPVEDDTQADWSNLLRGEGTWKLRDTRDGSAPSVDLFYDQASDSSLYRTATYTGLLSLGVKGSLHLFMAVDDPDLKYRFVFDYSE